MASTNPFFEPWDAELGAPPFDRIVPAHYAPAYERGMADHEAEIAAIVANPEGAPPIVPFVFIIIACGAGSGFHGLGSSGTTARSRWQDITTLAMSAKAASRSAWMNS